MTSLDLIVSFASSARHASFARAARELGLSPSAVAKNIARFEAQLGMRLFHRTTRQVTLSQDGENIYARCQRILEDVESLEAAATEARSGPRGTLCIDMPVTYVAGTWDSITSAKMMRIASEHTPHSRYVELPATHFVPLQFPARMSTELHSLVDRCRLT